MTLLKLYEDETILLTADDRKNHVLLEISSSGYRPKYVSKYFESQKEIDDLIEALQKAKLFLKK